MRDMVKDLILSTAARTHIIDAFARIEPLADFGRLTHRFVPREDGTLECYVFEPHLETALNFELVEIPRDHWEYKAEVEPEPPQIREELARTDIKLETSVLEQWLALRDAMHMYAAVFEYQGKLTKRYEVNSDEDTLMLSIQGPVDPVFGGRLGVLVLPGYWQYRHSVN
mgnify:CR=1 FL=1